MRSDEADRMEFELHHFDLDGEIGKGELKDRPHCTVLAVSPVFNVFVEGEGSSVVQRRTLKPFLFEGVVWNVLVMEMDGVFVYLHRNNVYVCREDLTNAQLRERLPNVGV